MGLKSRHATNAHVQYLRKPDLKYTASQHTILKRVDINHEHKEVRSEIRRLMTLVNSTSFDITAMIKPKLKYLTRHI